MKLRKCIAVILSLTLIIGTSSSLVISNPASVHAAGIIGEITTDTSGLNHLTVSAALNAYFNSREAFLLNQASTIDALFAGIEDEAAHRETHAAKGIVFINSAISIGNIIAGDTYADAEVTETVTYVKDGVTNTATVTHKLLLGLDADNVPAVVYDGYYEAFSDFRSCSYVDEADTASPNYFVGSGSCVVHVAEGELGYTEGTNGYTKYGEWFNLVYGESLGHDYTNETWCVMFVSWCAALAQIRESIIEHNANQTEMLNFFNGLGRYHTRTTAVNDWAPATGDLIFFADDRVNASHIGIVRYVDANYIYVVHGNNSQGKVAYMTVSRTNDWVLGYAKPAYDWPTHPFETEADGEHHWLQCEICDYQQERSVHIFDSTYTVTSNYHWKKCSECYYRVDYSEHIASSHYSRDSTFHWQNCRTCGYDMMKVTHTFVQSEVGWTYECSVCGYTTNSPILGLPTIPVLPYSFNED